MSVHKITAALLLCLTLISGMYSGSTAAYVFSVSANCENTFIGESVTEITTSEETSVTTTLQNSTTKSDTVKKSPATGNTAYKYVLPAVLLLSLILTTLIKRKTTGGIK